MKNIEHFLLTENTNSLYKKEAISSIGLTRDVADKINELVDAYNQLAEIDLEWKQTQEGTIRKGVLFMKDNLVNSLNDLLNLLLQNGYVDDCVKKHIHNLIERVDNLIKNETVDGEIIDLRFGVNGETYTTAGDAIRTQLKPLLDNLIYQVKRYNHIFKNTLLMVESEVINGYGFIVDDKTHKAHLADLDSGVIRYGKLKAGYYKVGANTIICKNEMTTVFDFYEYWITKDTEGVYVGDNYYFYVFGNNVPQMLVEYEEKTEINNVLYKGVDGEEIHQLDNISGLLMNTKTVLRSAGEYMLSVFPVIAGQHYHLHCDAFTYPSDVYYLYGFVKTLTPAVNTNIIPSIKMSKSGEIDEYFTSYVDGFLLVSNGKGATNTFTLHEVETLNAYIKNGTMYNKLLTIGDSLSGNMNLWQPDFISELNIREYTTAGGAGLTVAFTGSNENSIYNHVKEITLDNDVDLITFWGGYNDFSVGVVIGEFDEQKNKATRDNKTFLGGAFDCIEKILSMYPTKKVVIIGTTPFNVNGEWQTKTNKNGNKITDFVNALESIAKHYSLPFVNMLEVSGFNDFNYSTYFLDQGYYLHPNNLGNTRIAKILSGFIRSLG